MTSPSKKSPAVNKLLNNIIGASREACITENVCIPPPIGCGKPATAFKDKLSSREYAISGLCQECQNKVFGTEEE